WQALQAQEVGRAKELVDRYFHRRFWEKDLRGFEWRLLWSRCQPNFERSFSGHTDAVHDLAFSPGSRHLATASLDNTVLVHDLETKQLVRKLGGFDGVQDVRALAYSPNGRLLAIKAGNRIRVWQTDAWQEVTSPLEATGAPQNEDDAI